MSRPNKEHLEKALAQAAIECGEEAGSVIGSMPSALAREFDCPVVGLWFSTSGSEAMKFIRVS